MQTRFNNQEIFEILLKVLGTPSPRGYLGRKVLVFISLQRVTVCKILITDELLAKYYK
jgi:hypothetical protein